MDIHGWDERYRTEPKPDLRPAPLVMNIAARMPPGRALDLACGAGRNALWLAEQGWSVTAVDGSATAIAMLREEAARRGLAIETAVADLAKREYTVEPDRWDLIVMSYYLQRDLFEPAKRGVRPGGVVIAIVHLIEPGHENSPFRVQPGELRTYFEGWEILDSYEGHPREITHRYQVAEIAARRPE
jgi:tellurite methyltransferase